MTSPYFNLDAERVVLREICTGSSHVQKIFEQLKGDDFSDKNHTQSFTSLKKAFDNNRIAEYSLSLLQAGTISTPDQKILLWDAVEIIQTCAQRKIISERMFEIDTALNDPTNDIHTLQQAIESLSQSLDPRVVEMPMDFNQAIISTLEEYRKPGRYMTTGLIDVDNRLYITRDSYLFIAARPSVGKTALGLTILLNNILRGRHGAFASMEMPEHQVLNRMASIHTGLPYSKIRDGNLTKEELAQYKAFFPMISDKVQNRHWLWCSKRLTIRKIREWAKRVRPDFLLIDYVQLIVPEHRSSSKVEDYEEISAGLLDLRKEINAPVIVLAQLNRDADGTIPRMSQLKGSGAFEQDASEVIIIDRPEAESGPSKKRNYHSKSGEEVCMKRVDGSLTGNAALIICKQRNGPQGVELVKYTGECMMFSDFNDSRVEDNDVPYKQLYQF